MCSTLQFISNVALIPHLILTSLLGIVLLVRCMSVGRNCGYIMKTHIYLVGD